MLPAVGFRAGRFRGGRSCGRDGLWSHVSGAPVGEGRRRNHPEVAQAVEDPGGMAAEAGPESGPLGDANDVVVRSDVNGLHLHARGSGWRALRLREIDRGLTRRGRISLRRTGRSRRSVRASG